MFLRADKVELFEKFNFIGLAEKVCDQWYNIGSGPVAQWIERLRPKEKVVRSTRAWVTIFVLMVKYRYGI